MMKLGNHPDRVQRSIESSSAKETIDDNADNDDVNDDKDSTTTRQEHPPLSTALSYL